MSKVPKDRVNRFTWYDGDVVFDETPEQKAKAIGGKVKVKITGKKK